MATSFKLLNLDAHIAEEILKHMQLKELFEILQLSTRVGNLVRNTVILHKAPKWLDVWIGTSRLVALYCGTDRIGFKFYDKRDSEKMIYEDIQPRTLKIKDGVIYGYEDAKKLEFGLIQPVFYACMSNRIQDVLKFIEFIASLFDVEVRNLKIHGAAFKYLQEILSVDILRRSRTLSIMAMSLTHEDMRAVLGDFQPQHLRIVSKTYPGFTYERIMNTNSFLAWDATWFTDQMLLNLVSEEITISDCNVSDEYVNRFLHQWMNNNGGTGMTGLMVLGRKEPRWNLERITQGLERFQGPPVPYFMLNSRNFEREFDGQLMNVRIVNQLFSSYLIFYGKYNDQETRRNGDTIASNPSFFFSVSRTLFLLDR